MCVCAHKHVKSKEYNSKGLIPSNKKMSSSTAEKIKETTVITKTESNRTIQN